MKDFIQFTLVSPDTIFGGDLTRTYVGRNGDLYDSVEERYIFFED